MQRRGFLLLLGATVIIVAAAIFALVAGDRTASRPPPGERALPLAANRLLIARLEKIAMIGIDLTEASLACGQKTVAASKQVAGKRRVRQCRPAPVPDGLAGEMSMID